MKVREILEALDGVDPDAEVLINRRLDDEIEGKFNFKLGHILRALII